MLTVRHVDRHLKTELNNDAGDYEGIYSSSPLRKEMQDGVHPKARQEARKCTSVNIPSTKFSDEVAEEVCLYDGVDEAEGA